MNAIIKIIIFSIVYLNIYLYFFGQQFKEYLDENWTEIRCYPHILPFAGLSSKAEGFTFFDKTFINFNICSYNVIKKMLELFTKPLIAVIIGLVNALKSMSTIINSFRSMSRVIRELYSALVESVYNRMGNTFAAFVYLQEKMKNMIKRQSAIFEVLMQFFTAMPFIFHSFSNGPIPRFAYWLSHYFGVMVAFIAICILCIVGGPFVSMFACPVCAFCFDGNTIIKTDKGDIAIRDLEIGQSLKDSIITGKIILKTDSYELYEYNGILVSGTHMVYDKNRWIRVKDISGIKSRIINTDLVCFTTNNNLLPINDILFRDYKETNNQNINYNIHTYMNNSLNKDTNQQRFNPIYCDDYKNNFYWGFSEDTLIDISGEKIPIKDLVDNVELLNGDFGIIGGFINDDTNIKWYDYNTIIVSGNTLVYEDNRWIRVYNSRYAKLTSKKHRLYNLITKDNILSINNIKFRDFMESNDEEVINNIDNYLMKNI